MERKKSDRWEKYTPEQRENSVQRVREYRKRLTPEQKEERNRKRREYQKKLTSEQKEEISKKKREYWKNLSLEKKEELERKRFEHWHKLTSEEKEKINRKNRENWIKLTPEQKEEMRQKWRAYRKKMTPERRKEMSQKWYYDARKKLTPEQKEEKNRKKREYRRNLSIEKKEEMKRKRRERKDNQKERENLKYCEGDLKTCFSRGMKQNVFCYKCQVQFSNSSALLEHIIMHITLPYLVLSRIDEHKGSISIKKENEDKKINNDLYSNIPQNVIHIKTEYIEYDEDIKYKINNTRVNKTLDSIKKESENSLANSDLYNNISQNIIHIKTESMEYDEHIKCEFDDIHVQTKTETEIKIENVLFYTHVKKETENT